MQEGNSPGEQELNNNTFWKPLLYTSGIALRALRVFTRMLFTSLWLLFLAFHRWRNRGRERLSTLGNIGQLSERANTWIQAIWLQGVCHCAAPPPLVLPSLQGHFFAAWLVPSVLCAPRKPCSQRGFQVTRLDTFPDVSLIHLSATCDTVRTLLHRDLKPVRPLRLCLYNDPHFHHHCFHWSYLNSVFHYFHSFDKHTQYSLCQPLGI